MVFHIQRALKGKGWLLFFREPYEGLGSLAKGPEKRPTIGIDKYLTKGNFPVRSRPGETGSSADPAERAARLEDLFYNAPASQEEQEALPELRLREETSEKRREEAAATIQAAYRSFRARREKGRGGLKKSRNTGEAGKRIF
uniref:Uncharacterized protein n=1 Tax=Apteryx owenii TaxID=8824 RepID=A0A8B9QDH3_APTOW